MRRIIQELPLIKKLNTTNKKVILVALGLVLVSISGLYLVAISGLYAASESTTLTVTVLGPPQCNDGIDNDGDGKIDYPDDPGCSSPSDNDESEEISPIGIGGGGLPPTTVNFSGLAYPNSPVFLLKDGQIVKSTLSDGDGQFQIKIESLSPGNYIFSLYGEDKEGIKSGLVAFILGINLGVITDVSDILIVPTITIDKSLTILGQSAPFSDIDVIVSSEEKEYSFRTTADKDGIYSYKLDASLLEFGEYETRVRAFINNLVSELSSRVNFKLTKEAVFIEIPEECPLKGDFNKDCRVNLVDFSILIYWFGRFNPPARIDLSGDNKVNLFDFSIMAFYWTG